MRDYTVEAGQTVRQGDLIGHAGSTGKSTGNHLHLSLYYDDDAAEPTDYTDYPAAGEAVSLKVSAGAAVQEKAGGGA